MKQLSGAKAFFLAACATAAAPVHAASDYVQCDGQSKGMGVAEGLARLTLVIGTLGLLGSPESDNVAERRFGAEGVAACDAALADGKGKNDDRRRSRLVLARAIHQLEAKNPEAALADVRRFPAIGGDRADDPEFLRSLALSALEIEAAILLRMNQPEASETVALKMAAQSPYDVQNLMRTANYLIPAPRMTDARKSFFAAYVKQAPQARLGLADAQEWAGDFAAAAATIEGLLAAIESEGVAPTLQARIAILHIMAGDAEKAAPLLAKARRDNDDRAATAAGPAGLDNQRLKDSITQADELLDFARIAILAKNGKMDEARTQFSARSRWLAPSVSLVSAFTELLQAGADPASFSGALARDPVQMRADAVKAQLDVFSNDAAIKRLYSAIRPILSEGDYTRLARTVRQTQDSKYLQNKQDDKRGEIVTIEGAAGVAGGEALLYHAALLAKARGKTGFAILPIRITTTSARIVIENPGESKIPADGFLEAETIISALAPRFPLPVK